MTYAIRFDYPESDEPLFAGLHKGALGWAPTLKTAMMFDSVEGAERILAGYSATARFGRVIQVKANQLEETA
jgi:hypothetical protein